MVLTAGGDHTILVAEEKGIPVDVLWAYGAGVQIHVENLAEYLAGREVSKGTERWEELEPAYQEMPVEVT